MEEKVISVAEYLKGLNAFIEPQAVCVLGEISDLKEHPVGHFFKLKDADGGGVLPCYLHPRVYKSLGFQIGEGMQVKASGSGKIRLDRGDFSFGIKSMELSGEGTLKKAYEILKKKLELEGLYKQKRPLPEFIRTVGVITSLSGAVIGDFKKNLLKLGIKVYITDCKVQGAAAADDVISNIKYFNNTPLGLDVLVIMRGGGSLEDIQAFNNELVVREIYASKIPTISAIGHDRDVPLSNLVADQAVSTPSIAALLIGKTWDPLKQRLPILETKLIDAFHLVVKERASRIAGIATHLIHKVSRFFEKYDELKNKLFDLFQQRLDAATEALNTQEKQLKMVDPARNLSKGYSIIFDKNGKVIKKADTLTVGQEITARLSQGEAIANISKIN